MIQSLIYGHAARAAILASCLVATAHGATPGEIDATFGTNGRTVVAKDSRAIGVRLPDGSLLVASQETPYILNLRRFDSEGQADPRFGIAGIAKHEFADVADFTHSVARATDGRIYFGGGIRKVRADRGWTDMAVFAVNAQGRAVTTFGDGGLASFDLANPLHSGDTDYAQALAIMSDGRLLAAAYSSDYYYEWDNAAARLPQLLRLNLDGSLDRKVDFGSDTNVCSGIAGLLLRPDGSLLAGDDSGIYALLDDSALQTFGVSGAVMDANFFPSLRGCLGLQSFTADQSGELLTVSAVNLPDGQLGIELHRLNENGTEIAGSVRSLAVPLGSLVRNAERFAASAISIDLPSMMTRPIKSAADGRLYLLFGFLWEELSYDERYGSGWAIARFAADGTLDTGWGNGGVVVLEKGDQPYWDSVPTLLEPLADGRIVALTPNGVLTRLLGGQLEGHGALNVGSGSDVVEAARQITIEVTRTGGSAGEVSVEYFATGSTDLGPATWGEDFSTEDYGRLDWADGDTSPREIVVYIFEDTLKEGDEHFDIEIRSPLGGAVLLNTRARVRISDDGDTATPPPEDATGGGGGAADVLTLILLSLLTAFSVVPRIRNYFFSTNPCGYRGPGFRIFYGHIARAAILATNLAATAHSETPGEMDPTFGQNGRTVVAENSAAIGLMLPDGSVLVASHLTNTLATLELRRFDSEGHADPAFGKAGVVHHEFAVSTDLLQSVAQGPSGRLYFGGWTARDGRNDMAVFAVDAQGAAVANFGDRGLLSHDLADLEHSGVYDRTATLAVMPDGRLLAAGFSADDNGYDYGFESYNRRPHLLRFNADGSLEQTVDLRQFNGDAPVCVGITGLMVRADRSLLVGDDTGIYAFLDDNVLQTFGVDGGVLDDNWYPHLGDTCLGLRSFAATPSGELLTVSVSELPDGQLGFALNRLQSDGSRIAGLAQAPPIPLAGLVGQDARFAGLSTMYHILMSPPMQGAADDRVYILFQFESDRGAGWAIARFGMDGTLDTGWGANGVVVLEKGGSPYYLVWDTAPTFLKPLPDGRIVAMSGNGVLTRLYGGQREGHGAINIAYGHDVVEAARQIRIEVTRTGGSAGAVSVEYSTTTESATAGEDFATVSGRLDWADGDTSPREIVVPILEDTLRERDEQFVVIIRSASGGAVLLNTQAHMLISDDGDTATLPPPPPPPPPPPLVSSGGGGASDGLTLFLLLSLMALSMARRVGNHFFLMNRELAFHADRRNLAS